MKTFLKNVLLGILIGSAIFTVIGIVFDIIYSGGFHLEDWGYTRMAIGSMLVGIGFSVPTVVYESERVPYPFQILVHMGIGCTVMLIVAFSVGWIPVEAGWQACALAVGGELLTAFLLWLGVSRYYRRLAKRMNAKIKDLQGDR